ncbi:MAG: peptidoglycan-associated lipoprotein Pal, partial [Mangrovicoccus sp.]
MRAQVLFLAEQYSLTPEARAELDRQAAWFAQHPTTTAVIEGHADEVGTRDYNIGLGERRAVAVREYLISKGVTASRLTTASFGKERPRAVCSDESCYAKNRRVETVVTTPAVADPVVAPSDAPIGVFVPFDPVPEAS